MRVGVEVTAEDIAAGVRGMCGMCPVALAMKRAGAPDPRVGAERIAWDGKELGVWWIDVKTFETPPQVTLFIDRFDHGRPVEPFAFDLEIPDAEAPHA